MIRNKKSNNGSSTIRKQGVVNQVSLKRREKMVEVKNKVQPPNVFSLTGFPNLQSARFRNKNQKVSREGMEFLKCAFAPTDFASTGVLGIPDGSNIKTVCVKHYYSNSVSHISGSDYYYLLLPIPGYAYFTATVSAGAGITATTVFTGVTFNEFSNMFGFTSLANANVLSAFRFVSQHIEIIPAVNQMSWSGMIRATKLPIRIMEKTDGAATANLRLTLVGLNSGDNSSNLGYIGNYNAGLYSGNYRQDFSSSFNDLFEVVTAVPGQVDASQDFGQLQSPTLSGQTIACGITGFDRDMESLMVKISGVGPNAESSIFRAWACVEYLPQSGTLLERFSSFPVRDQLALDLYNDIIRELPVGVTYLDNENFWKRVLDIVKRVSGTLSILPGPYGMLASGVNSVATGIGSLTM